MEDKITQNEILILVPFVFFFFEQQKILLVFFTNYNRSHIHKLMFSFGILFLKADIVHSESMTYTGSQKKYSKHLLHTDDFEKTCSLQMVLKIFFVLQKVSDIFPAREKFVSHRKDIRYAANIAIWKTIDE